jgi:hypothetical protein
MAGMTRLWFVMPVHGRPALTAICLRQLRRTCDELAGEGIDATAVTIGDDENLDTARDLGFATIVRNNDYLARKYNDGLQLACDPSLNPEPADYAVPIGSDDWIDHRILLNPPTNYAVMGFRHIAFVDENGAELTETRLGYEGGSGIRIYPAGLLAVTGYRPADEDRRRACDTSILWNTRHEYHRVHGGQLTVVYGDQHPRQIVDWKTHGHQMNAYQTVASRHAGLQAGNPFDLLQGIYPDEALAEMAEHYRSPR